MIRERDRINSRLSTECGAHHKAQSHHPEILTRAEIKSHVLNPRSPGRPSPSYFRVSPALVTHPYSRQQDAGLEEDEPPPFRGHPWKSYPVFLGCSGHNLVTGSPLAAGKAEKKESFILGRNVPT